MSFRGLGVANRENHVIMQSLVTAPLGLYGWTELEPILLAALVSEEPLLLVGPHGCAKSFVLERLAESLGLAFRCYNASLINYDDLVGIPMPDDTRTSLHFLAGPECIWDAEVVFIDELNRTRPDLQNKLFPIIHERRVQGRPLEKLRYRWAAMNPPPSEEDLADDSAGAYLGAEPLDAALADRFPFIVPVPAWRDLGEAEQRQVLADQFQGRHEFPVAIADLIAEAKAEYRRLQADLPQRLVSFVLSVVPRLQGANFDVSTRRATMLLRCILAVHAARLVLARRTAAEEAPSMEGSVLLAVRNALPDRARRPLSEAQITGLCREAWTDSALSADDPMRAILHEADPQKRLEKLVPMHESFDASQVAKIVCRGIATAKPPLRRGLALATYLALRGRADLPASTMELLANEVAPVFRYSEHTALVASPKARPSRAVASCMQEVSTRPEFAGNADFLTLHGNLLQSFLPDGYVDDAAPAALSTEFIRLWKEFRLQ